MRKAIRFLLLLSIVGARVHAQTPSSPNIIYIYADDLGYGELGCYGQQKIRTPHLDQLAQEGMRFTQHYSSAPVCAPSRYMLLTGQQPGHAYIRGNYELGGYTDSTEGGQLPLYPQATTLATLLKKRGYRTAMVGKWGLGAVGTSGSPLLHGFDYYYGYLDQKQAHNYYPTHLWENDRWDSLKNPAIPIHISINAKTATDADFKKFIGQDYAPTKMTEKALQFINNNNKSPFFLYLPYTLPHLALQVPEPYLAPYIKEFIDTPYYGANGYAPCKFPKATYAAMVSFLDEQVGIIMNQLKKLGLDQNTLVLFSSDNGTSFSAGVNYQFFNSVGGLRGLKMEVYEGGIRVPFIARWPGKIAKNTTSDLVSVQYDVMATLAELTGTHSIQTDGISFLPTLLGQNKKQTQHPFIYFEYPENGGQIAVRMGDWKGVRKNLKKDPHAPWELYNIKNDPFEKIDCASQNPTILNAMEKVVAEQHQHAPITDWEFLHPKTK
jgi:arylsulfatase A-like enzyme